MQPRTPFQWLALIGGPAVLVTLFGHMYMSIATVSGGAWFGANWEADRLRIVACGVFGVLIAAHTAMAAALPVFIGAFAPDAGNLSVGLATTRVLSGDSAHYTAQHNTTMWQAILFGGPAIVVLCGLRVVGLPFNASIAIGAIAGLLLWMARRLREAHWPLQWRATLWLVASIAFCCLLSLSLYLVGLAWWRWGYLESGWIHSFGLAGWAIVVVAACAWLFSPADRPSMQRRSILVLGLTLVSSFSTINSLQIVRTTLAYTANGGTTGVLVARTPKSVLDLPAAACADAECTRSIPIEVIGYINDRIVFWFRRPVGDGLHTLERDDVQISSARFEMNRSERPRQVEWMIF